MNRPGSQIASLIAQLRGRINAFLLSRLAEEGITGLAPSHGAIFVVLFHDGPQPMMALSEKIRRDKSTLTVLVRKLENLGYVRREPDGADKRVSIIHLTEKGLQFQALFESISGELIDKIWGETPLEERRAIDDTLKKMLERV